MKSLTDCVTERRSIRAFTDQPVSHETLVEILTIARRSPSGNNMQPWYVNVLTGDALAGLVQKIREVAASNPMGEGTEYDLYPPKMAEPYRTRRFKCGEDMYAILGLERENKLGRMMQLARNFEFFGAPVGMFFSIDRRFGPAQWAHLGMFIQTVMLLAQERGLSTCAQEAWSGMYKTVSAQLELPEEQMLYCGLALGYADEEAPINTFVTERADLDEFVKIRGFVEA